MNDFKRFQSYFIRFQGACLMALGRKYDYTNRMFFVMVKGCIISQT